MPSFLNIVYIFVECSRKKRQEAMINLDTESSDL